MTMGRIPAFMSGMIPYLSCREGRTAFIKEPKMNCLRECSTVHLIRHRRVIYSFLKRLVFFWLLMGGFIWLPIMEISCVLGSPLKDVHR